MAVAYFPFDWQTTFYSRVSEESPILWAWTLVLRFDVRPDLTTHGGPYRGVAEEAEYDHDERRGEDGAEHDGGQAAVDQGDDHILRCDQHRACPAVQGAP